MAYTICQAVAC